MRDKKVYIPEAKVERIAELLNAALAANAVTAKEMQSLSGKLLDLNPGTVCRSRVPRTPAWKRATGVA